MLRWRPRGSRSRAEWRLRTCNRSISDADRIESASSNHPTHRLPNGEEQMGEIIDKTKGKIKQAAGVLSGDKKLEQEGKVDEAKGRVKGAIEDVKHAAKVAVKE
jgi:uncharacterized protein YjbJ (UPF0337 family)